MYPKLLQTVELFKNQPIREERKAVLMNLTEFVQRRIQQGKPISINFICTHNSRRSHFSQIWAQIASAYFDIPGVISYSGGTESTAVYSKVIETLQEQGCKVIKISDSENPTYAIRYDEDHHPIIGFSKKYDHPFNPVHGFAAVMTCSQADGGCPFIPGAEQRIAIPFEDPKVSDGTESQTETYHETSLLIGAEMFYIFSQIKTEK